MNTPSSSPENIQEQTDVVSPTSEVDTLQKELSDIYKQRQFNEFWDNVSMLASQPKSPEEKQAVLPSEPALPVRYLSME